MCNLVTTPNSEHHPQLLNPSEDFVEQVLSCMRERGYMPLGDIVFDGKIHRFSTNEDPKDTAGWYIFFNDGVPSGTFGDWRTGEKWDWHAKTVKPLTKDERSQIKNKQKEAKRIQEQLLGEQYKKARNESLAIWNKAKPAPANHQYLQKKKILPHIARISNDNELIIPVYNDDHTIMSLQKINSSGKKRFHKGGKTVGGFCILGELKSANTAYLVEGYATGASVYENIDGPVVVCFSANNLKKVAVVLKKSYSAMNLVIVADNDENGVGEKKAHEAAEMSGATVIVLPEGGDANDYVNSGGDLRALVSDSVKKQHQQIFSDLDIVFGNELTEQFNPPDELIENFICSDSITMIFGNSNSGKTFFSLAMAQAVSSGESFLGKRTERGLVVYIACESPGSVESRLQVIRDTNGVDLSNIAIIRKSVNFHTNTNEVNQVARAIKAMEQLKGEKSKLIIIDTLARISAGANENSGDEMGPVFAMFDLLKSITHAAIVIIHHSGKDEARGSRGWSGMRAHIDTEIEIKKGKASEQGSLHTAKITKQRDLGSNGEQLYFKLKVVDIGTTKFGQSATSCIVIPADNQENEAYPLKLREDIQSLVKAYKEVGKRINYEDGDMPFLPKNGWSLFIQEHEKNPRTGEKLSEGAALQKLKVSVGNQGKKNRAVRLIEAGIIAEYIGGFLVLKNELVYED